MLINLTPYWDEINRRKAIDWNDCEFEYIPQFDQRLMIHGDGIYRCNVDFNFSHEEFEEFKNDGSIDFDSSFKVFAPNYEKSQYGVADNVDQVKEYYKEEIENPNKNFIITYTPVCQDKSNKGKGGGWRWHKWGEYIGKLNPVHEYLDDEDFGNDFQYVICFHLFEIKNKP